VWLGRATLDRTGPAPRITENPFSNPRLIEKNGRRPSASESKSPGFNSRSNARAIPVEVVQEEAAIAPLDTSTFCKSASGRRFRSTDSSNGYVFFTFYNNCYFVFD